MCELAANRSFPMWPIMTLTLLLQLTSEEQLYAQDVGPVLQPQVEEQVAPAPVVTTEERTADRKEVGTTDC